MGVLRVEKKLPELAGDRLAALFRVALGRAIWGRCLWNPPPLEFDRILLASPPSPPPFVEPPPRWLLPTDMKEALVERIWGMSTPPFKVPLLLLGTMIPL